ncbi:hypothetical protein C2W62_08665 [Candidatus Entotheonella serta]|nr:hypothetical protein C2W62_08665 [Candidatus Entotheonella serta]
MRSCDYPSPPPLRAISHIIQFFQKHRLITPQSNPRLSDEIEQLVMELTTLPFAEQNEVWNALRTSYRPSVLYKVKMVVFHDDEPVEVSEIETQRIQLQP